MMCNEDMDKICGRIRKCLELAKCAGRDVSLQRGVSGKANTSGRLLA